MAVVEQPHSQNRGVRIQVLCPTEPAMGPSKGSIRGPWTAPFEPHTPLVLPLALEMIVLAPRVQVPPTGLKNKFQKGV